MEVPGYAKAADALTVVLAARHGCADCLHLPRGKSPCLREIALMNVDVWRLTRHGTRPGGAGRVPTQAPTQVPRSKLARALHGLRMLCGIGLVVFGAMLFVDWLAHDASAWWRGLDPTVRAAWWGGAMAAGATALGTLPILFSRGVHDREMVAMLAFSAGVMLAASVFSLLLPAHQAAIDLGRTSAAALRIVATAAVSGAAVLLVVDLVCRRLRNSAGVPDDAPGPAGQAWRALRRSWLFVLAIVLHNIPEGLSIGVGYAGVDAPHARALAAAIAFQDLPEGLVVALALRAVGYGRGASLAAGMASGLVEPLAAIAGALLVGVSARFLPWALAAAAGAMLFAIAHEIAPLLWRGHHRRLSGALLLFGFALMTALDNLFTASSL